MRSKSGRVILPWIFIILMVGSLFWLLNRVNLGRLQMDGCEQNLQAIYEALRLYEINNGALPTLALYPGEAAEDEDSIVKVLHAVGLEAPHFVCPASPQAVRDHGISYLWNTTVNGQSLDDRNEPKIGRAHV